MNLNLILALFWGVLCVGLFAYPVLNPRGGRLTIGDSGVSFAWVAVLFCCYNLARWWMFRMQKRDREVMERPSGHRRPRVEERHPEFDFSDDAEKKDGK
jgi:hypothetical protein